MERYVPELYADSEKLIDVSQFPISKQLADLSLHRDDCEKALEALHGSASFRSYNGSINGIETQTLEQILLFFSICSFYKCFGENKSRSSLNKLKVYQNPSSIKTFEYYRNIRDKFLVHDENRMTATAVGAALNPINSERKIERILTTAIKVISLDAAAYENLDKLISEALVWIKNDFIEKSAKLTEILEKQEHHTLGTLPKYPPDFEKPTLDNIHTRRR